MHKTTDGKHPNGEEQQMLWLTNRARQNPTREGIWLAKSKEYAVTQGRDYFNVNLDRLIFDFAKLSPKPPAAFDVRLYRAALEHSKTQISRDTQDHIGQDTRIDEQGFFWRQYRGNVFSYSTGSLNAHGAFNIDWGPGTLTGMQEPAGHRLAIMSVDGDYTNVGISGTYELDPRTKVGRYIVSQNFCHADSTKANHYNAFIVGTVWKDDNNNDRYDVGEGYAGVTVTPSLGDHYAVTSKGGGYAIPITHTGQMQLQFSGSSILDTSLDVAVGDVSVLADYKMNSNGVLTSQSRLDGTPPRVFLSKGVTDKNRYGNKWGNDRHERVVRANFDHSRNDLLLTMVSHHISRANEVEVFANGDSLGFLNRSQPNANEQTNRFVIPKEILTETNHVEIRQRFTDTKWGIDQLRLVDASSGEENLRTGATLRGPFGWGVGGRPHRAVFRTTFNSTNDDLDLRFEAMNIARQRDLEVRLNGAHIGWVRPGASKAAVTSNHITIPSHLQSAGENLIEFRALKSNRWGVRNLRLLKVSGPIYSLAYGETDPRRYGWRFPGAAHRTLVKRSFISRGEDLVVSWNSRFSDNRDGIKVFVNGIPVGQQRAAQKPGKRKLKNQRAVVSVPAAIQEAGTNIIEFRRKSRSPKRWFVSDITLSAVANPTEFLETDRVVTTSSRRYGWRFGSGKHRTVVRLEYNAGQAPTDRLLSVRGYDIGGKRQVAVHLNGRRIGFLSMTNGILNGTDEFLLPLADQNVGTNVLEFRNRVVNDDWGVTGLALRKALVEPAPISLGVTNYRGYGIRGANRDPVSLVSTNFYATGDDLDLGVVGYDIERAEKISVYLNNAYVGRLTASINNGHNIGEHFFLPTALQRPGLNTLQFRRDKAHSRWGITRLAIVPLKR